MLFASREDAGQKLGAHLKQKGLEADLVLGLPRGGVIVAAQVAHVLQLPLHVLIARKIGHPWHREFAVGAMAEEDVVVLDQTVIEKNPLIRPALDEIIAEEKQRLQAYRSLYRQQSLEIAGKTVLLVDDGLATGATTEAAALSAQKQNANKIIVATPIASPSAVERLRQVSDEVWALDVDPEFDAVGHYYELFSQTTDEEVLDLLRSAAVLKTSRSA